MIKQITLKNLYNFIEEITMDFDTSGKGSGLYHQYNKDKISNFSLVYGKNNVGKTNFFRALRQGINFILESKMELVPYYPLMEEEPSLFEIILEGDDHEIRYGFELLIKSAKIKDEWMYAKLNGSQRESKIFTREEFYTHQMLGRRLSSSLKDLKERTLFLFYLNGINHDLEVVNDFISKLNAIQFIDCINEEKVKTNKYLISQLANDKDKVEKLNLLLKAADLDITSIKVSKLSDKQLDIIEQLRAIKEMDVEPKEKADLSKQVISSNIENFSELLGKDVFMPMDSQEDKFSGSIEYIHRNGASFSFTGLSSGTQQIISIFTTFFANYDKPTTFIFDEIETGLHQDLLTLAMEVFRASVLSESQHQYIITTHREDLLDFEFISNENKILLKYDKKTKSPFIEYISEYKLREYQKVSQRYQHNAFLTNPDTSYAYDLVHSIQSGEVREDK